MRSYLLSALLLGLAVVAARLPADDVHPQSKFGYVVVHAPGEEHKPLSNLQVYFTKKDVGSTQVTEAGKAFKVFAGTGCLSVARQGGDGYRTERCGIQVQEKQTVVIDLARVDLDWNYEPMRVDVGPAPALSLASQTEAVTLSMRASAASRTDRPFYMLFPGSYQAVFGDVAPLKGHEIGFQIGDLDSRKEDLTPPDVRSEIGISAEPIHLPFPRRSGYYYVNEVTVAERDFTRLPEDLYRTYVQRTGSLSYVEVSLSATQQEVRLHAYALSAEQKATLRYDIAVNNILVPIEVIPNQTTPIELGTLNVFHLDGEKKGFYQVVQLQPGQVGAPDRRRINWNYSGRLLEGDAPPRFEDQEAPEYGSSPYFNTGTSILVPRGFKYTVSTFAFDELKDFKPQSQYDIDLR